MSMLLAKSRGKYHPLVEIAFNRLYTDEWMSALPRSFNELTSFNAVNQLTPSWSISEPWTDELTLCSRYLILFT